MQTNLIDSRTCFASLIRQLVAGVRVSVAWDEAINESRVSVPYYCWFIQHWYHRNCLTKGHCRDPVRYIIMRVKMPLEREREREEWRERPGERMVSLITINTKNEGRIWGAEKKVLFSVMWSWGGRRSSSSSTTKNFMYNTYETTTHSNTLKVIVYRKACLLSQDQS